MKFKNLLLAIAVVLIGFWLLSIVLKIAAWILQIFIVVAAIVVIAYLLAHYSNAKNKSK